MEQLTSDDFPNCFLAVCPELEWPDAEDDVGVYLTFGLGILPALRYLFPENPGLRVPAPTVDTSGDEPYFRSMPSPGTAEADDLVRRMYDFIERAAQRGDDVVTMAIKVELGDGGYEHLSVNDLVERAGPATRRLVLG